MKKLTLGFVATTLLLALTGCGFKLDSAMLSKDGGVWKIGDDYYAQFNNDNEGALYTSDKEKLGSFNYEVTDENNEYCLNIDSKLFNGGIEDIIVTVPKKDQSNDQFTGEIQVGMLGENGPKAEETFTRAKASVLK